MTGAPMARPIATCVLLALVLPLVSLARAGAQTSSAVSPAGRGTPPRAEANSNQRPAGTVRGGVLSLRLVAQPARWHPEADDGPFLDVEALGVEGVAPSIPGPLIRVRAGTRVETSIRNALPDTLLVFGLSGVGGRDTVRIAPGATGQARLTAGTPGSYGYGGVTIVGDSLHQLGTGNQLLGALIVDGANPRPDRIFVLSIWPPDPGRFVMAINGKSWPHTERLDMSAGDSVHWRVINGTRGRHPMHLHGFYFRIDARGSWAADTVLRGERPNVVTESVPYRGTFSMTWTAERPGNWLFHCHDGLHTSWRRRFNLTGEQPPQTPPMHDAAHHVEQDMSGLVLGIRVRGATGGSARSASTGVAQRRERLVVTEKAGFYGRQPGYSYIASGVGEPARDSLEIPARPLVLTRGDRTEITVVNRLTIPTAVHWHGIELDSYYDGVAGWSGNDTGDGTRLAPLIAPGDSFVVRMTPPRAGTFIFHAHVDDMRQIALGLYGALIVLPPGDTWQPATDHIFLLSQIGRGPTSKTGLDGSVAPTPITLAAGVRHRFRFINISVADDAQLELRSDTSSATTSDASLVTWRAIAKDGADLHRDHATTRPAMLAIAPGETYDYEVTLAPGSYRLSVKSFNDFSVMLHAR
jgi:FtsP/CotA-like multicopper oxidase with cupredoxin domain